MPSRLASNFIAIQGVADTEYIFSGFTPACSATKVLMSAPATCWGDLTVENRGEIDGINCSAYLTQAGQADIYKGVLSFSSIFVFSSSAISEIQISVPVPVMKTLSNPILRRMEFSILSKSLLYLIPSSSAMPVVTRGEYWITLTIPGLFRYSCTSDILCFS